MFVMLAVLFLPACLSDSFGQPSMVQHLPNPSPFQSEPSTVAGLFRGREPVAGGCLVRRSPKTAPPPTPL